jgi:hypothetical protein
MIKAILNKSFIRDFIVLIDMPRRIFYDIVLYLL